MGRTQWRTEGGQVRTESASPMLQGRRTGTRALASPVRPSAGAALRLFQENNLGADTARRGGPAKFASRSKSGSLSWGALCGGRGPRPFTLSGDFES